MYAIEILGHERFGRLGRDSRAVGGPAPDSEYIRVVDGRVVTNVRRYSVPLIGWLVANGIEFAVRVVN